MESGEGRGAAASDTALVRRAAAGDAAAWACLVERYWDAAYRMARSVVGRHEDAEDVTQDSLIKAFQSLERCGMPDRFRGWLLTIVRNRSLNFLRRESLWVRGDTPVPAHANAGPRPDSAVEAAELFGLVEEGLEELPGVRKQVFVMHHFEGWRQREIAEELGLKHGTVRSHLCLARRALRMSLEDYARSP